MSKILFLISFFTTWNSHADIIWTNLEGYSQQQGFGINNNTAVTILGGFAGEPEFIVTADPLVLAQCSTLGGTSTCDNCRATIPQQCNTKRAYPELDLRFTFSSTDKFGTPKMTVQKSTETQPTVITSVISSVTATTAPEQSVTLTVKWSALCAAISESGSDTSCDLENSSQAFKIGFDGGGDPDLEDETDDNATFTVVVSNPLAAFNTTDPTTCTAGLCDFTFFPGDKKAYVENARFGSSPIRPISKAHFLCQSEDNGGFASILGNTFTASIAVLNGALSENIINGFENGVVYSCYSASEDDTGNIGLYMTTQDQCPAGATVASGLTSCRQFKPDEVGGLFKDNCFIATAAYGSLMEPQVKVLRLFRDKYLRSHLLGQQFIRLYYKISPPIAKWISVSENRRAVTRALLSPVVFSVKSFMAAPIISFLILLIIAALTVGWVIKKSSFFSKIKGSL